MPARQIFEVAERIGDLTLVSGYIPRQVCAGFAALPGGGGMRLGVNVVARHLLIPTFAELVLSTLQDTGLSPGRLTLEIVETA